MAGSRIVVEAARRGHDVSGFSRSGGRSADLPGIGLFIADATDPEAMRRIGTDHDVLVLATRPTPGTEASVALPVSTVLDAALETGRRVMVIGGAGPLQVPGGGGLVMDDERFVPKEWRAIARASVDQFTACAVHGADWSYLSPPALFGPGKRTGNYRRGGPELIVDAEGISRISAEDLAIAAVDEMEKPQPGLRHFTVAY